MSERLARTLLVMGSTAVMLLTLEAGARILLSRRPPGKEAAESRLYAQYHPLLGWSKRPGARVTYRRREYTVEVAISRGGLRDVEREHDPPPGTCRILALGDSYVEAYSVPLYRAVTQVLEAGLRDGGVRAEVINGGTNGYSTDQEYLFYLSDGVKYSPRIVVLFFHYNDVVYNERQEYFGAPKPALEMTGGALRVHRYPVREPVPVQASVADRKEDQGSSGSALRALICDRLWYGAPRQYGVLANIGACEPMPQAPIRLELRVYQRSTVVEIEEAWKKTGAILAALARVVQGRGAKFLVVGIPSRLEVDERAWELTRALYGVDDRTWDRALVMKRLSGIGRTASFPVLDLTDALRAGYRGFGQKPYYPYDGHWTARGHAIAAAEVQRLLTEQRWLAHCGTP